VAILFTQTEKAPKEKNALETGEVGRRPSGGWGPFAFLKSERWLKKSNAHETVFIQTGGDRQVFQVWGSIKKRGSRGAYGEWILTKRRAPPSYSGTSRGNPPRKRTCTRTPKAQPGGGGGKDHHH